MARSITVNLSSPDIINMTGKWSFNKYLKVSYTWSNAPSGMKSTVPIDSNKYKPGDLVSVDGTYSNKTGYVGDPVGTGTGYHINDTEYPSISIAYLNGVYIAVSYETIPGDNYAYYNTYMYSTDGINWIKKTFSYNYNLYGLFVCSNDEKFIISGYFGYSNNYSSWNIGVINYSTDGINWTSKMLGSMKDNMAAQHYNCGLYYINNTWYLIGGPFTQNTHYPSYSYDGLTFNKINVTDKSSVSSSRARTWRSLAYGNGIYLAANTVTYGYSTDGINWELHDPPLLSRVDSVCYGNGKFVLCGSNELFMMYSTDGINWTKSKFTSSDSNKYFNSLLYYKNTFLMFPTESQYIYYSKDAITWTELKNNNLSKSLRYSYPFICNDNNLWFSSYQYNAVFNFGPTMISLYQFSGWNKSDFNITSDTAIGGSWSTVSSSSGLTLVD